MRSFFAMPCASSQSSIRRVHNRSTGVGTGREIGTALAGGVAPLWAWSTVASSATHSTTGVVLILVCSGLMVTLAALFDQGHRFSRHKN